MTTAPVVDTFLAVGGDDPRFAFMEELIRIAENDERVVALDADVSRRTLTRHFRDRFPTRFWDMGVAEQNLMGTTAGLAAAGRLPWAFAFAVFVSMRAVEPIRTSICYPRLNAKLIGGYAGLSNGKDGATHQSIEDVSIMRSFPNLVVLSPSDSVLAAKVARAAYEHDEPVDIRIEYEETPAIHRADEQFEIGRGLLVRRAGTSRSRRTGSPWLVQSTRRRSWRSAAWTWRSWTCRRSSRSMRTCWSAPCAGRAV